MHGQVRSTNSDSFVACRHLSNRRASGGTRTLKSARDGSYCKVPSTKARLQPTGGQDLGASQTCTSESSSRRIVTSYQSTAKMRLLFTLFAVLPALATASPYPRQRRQSSGSSSSEPLLDLSVIQSYWGQLTPYADNAENFFGVNATGLPDGCQVEQAHLLQRHGSRFPTSYFDDGVNNENFASKVFNWTQENSTEQFSGPLSFLNSYRYQMGESYLVGTGASQLFQSGVTFWERYGRVLYNASVGQLAYNTSFPNGTARTKPVLRTTSQSRIENTQINWALGFFGPSFLQTPNPTLANATSPFNLVIIPEGGTENNTLASYDSCFNDNKSPEGLLGDYDLLFEYVPIYLADANDRLSQYVPSGFNLTLNDTYAMQ